MKIASNSSRSMAYPLARDRDAGLEEVVGAPGQLLELERPPKPSGRPPQSP